VVNQPLLLVACKPLLWWFLSHYPGGLEDIAILGFPQSPRFVVFIQTEAILLLGLFLRFYRIDFLTLWFDESHTIYASENFFKYMKDI